MPGLEDQELLARERVDSPLDLVDAAEHILEGSCVVDGGANQPHLSEGEAEQEDGLACWRDSGDTPEERREGCGGDRHPPVERGHAERDQRVQRPVLLQEHADLALLDLDARRPDSRDLLSCWRDLHGVRTTRVP
jgi:hypothetical protein